MRCFLLFLTLLLAAGSAVAQKAPVARPDSLIAIQAAPDTAAAIHRLFAAKRKRNISFFAGTLGAAAVGGVLLGTASSGWDGLGQAVLGVAIIGLVCLPALIGEASTALNYNKKREQRAVEDFQAHKVPRKLKRSLKPKYFQEPQRSVTSRE